MWNKRMEGRKVKIQRITSTATLCLYNCGKVLDVCTNLELGRYGPVNWQVLNWEMPFSR